MEVPMQEQYLTASFFHNILSASTIPIDHDTWLRTFDPILPLLCMAMLVRYPHTKLLRLMLFPIVVLTSLRSALVYLWTSPEHIAYNALKSYICAVLIAKAIDYAFYAEGIQRCQKEVKEVAKAAEDYEIGADGVIFASAEARVSPPKWKHFRSVLSPLSDALDLACSLRGIGYGHGEGLCIPPEYRPLKKWLFIRATFRKFVVRFLLVDLIDLAWKLASPFNGGSIFIQSLSWKSRYFVSTLYHISTGCMIIWMFELFYYLFTILAILILNQSPTDWPPIFHRPFSSQSLHEFWAVRWHQLFRRVFFVFGGLPGYLIWKRLGLSQGRGLLFGTFIASGLFHELPLYALGHGFYYRMPLFFISQAIFMLGERNWRRMTGYRVSGWMGRAWVILSVVLVGQNTFTSPLHERGIAKAMLIPPMISPARWMIEYLSNKSS